MAEKLDPKELVSFKELLMANSIKVDAAVFFTGFYLIRPKR